MARKTPFRPVPPRPRPDPKPVPPIPPRPRPVPPVPPRPRPDPPRPVPPKPVPPRPVPPEPEEDLDAIVEDVCRFIEECRRRHARNLGMLVGEYLYLHVYRMDDAYIASRSPLKTRSLRDIAERTGYGHRLLGTWVIAAAARMRLGALGFDGDHLGLEHFAALYDVKDHPGVALELAEWAERERVTSDVLAKWVERWKRVIEEGGDLDDVREGLPGPKHGPRRKGRQIPPDDLRFVRVLEMVGRWLDGARFSDERRAEILGAVRAIGRMLGRGPAGRRRAPAGVRQGRRAGP